MLDFKEINFKKSDFLIYFILIPFMYPRGFSEYFSWYKLFFTLWTYGAAAIIVLLFIYKVINGFNKYKHYLLIVLGYFGYLALDTLVIQGSIASGIQKIFIAPILCLFCFICFEERVEQFVKCLANILVVVFVLNVSIFNPMIFSNYFNIDEHLIFIGHVQIATQLGLLGIFASWLLKEWKYSLFSKILWIMSIVTIIMSDTAVGKIVLAIYFMCVLIEKIPMIRNVLFADGRSYVLLGVGLNIVLFLFMQILNGQYMRFGFDLSLSGRMFIWKESFLLIKDAPLWGYGVYGVLIHVFWNMETGMNYAHNEMIQKLLDGGWVLLILFVVLLFLFASNTRKVKNQRIKKYANIMLLLVSVVMLIESVTEYYYVYIIWLLVAHLPEIEKSIERKKEVSYGSVFMVSKSI